MRLIVFGATGGAGQQILQRGLENGRRMTAFVRRPEEIVVVHKRLTIAKGDVLDQYAVESAITSQDAVPCALGVTGKSPLDVCSRGTRNIVSGMHGNGVKRLVFLTGAIIGHPPTKVAGRISPHMEAPLPGLYTGLWQIDGSRKTSFAFGSTGMFP